MRTTSYRSSSYQSGATLRGRATSIVLAVVLVVLIMLALLKMGGLAQRPPADDRPFSTFDIAASRTAAAGVQRPKKAPSAAKRTTPPAATTRVTTDRPPPPPPVPVPIVPGMILLSPDQFAASDIGKMRRGEQASTGSAGSASADSTSAYGPGDGPGGQPLYDAEWYREPTRAEMVTYLPQRAQVGWGMIACQTVERFHVDNCRELGETPGSGIARALRQASFQFLVRPPRIGGKPVIGAWVRIKFDLVVGVTK